MCAESQLDILHVHGDMRGKNIVIYLFHGSGHMDQFNNNNSNNNLFPIQSCTNNTLLPTW